VTLLVSPFKTTREELKEPLRMNWLIPTFRWVGITEGLSYLILLLVAMPLKYAMGQPLMVSIVGGIHGGLFVAYLLLAAVATWYYKWNVGMFVQAFVASLVPIGTFWFDRKLKDADVSNRRGAK
jgi:integral membrane protein